MPNDTVDHRAHEGDVRYTLTGASWLLGIPAPTVRRWARGYTQQLAYSSVQKKGVIALDEDEGTLLTFPALVELYVVKELLKPYAAPQVDLSAYPKLAAQQRYKTEKRKLEDICKLSGYLRSHLGEYPLARARLREIGRQLVTKELQPGLWTDPLLEQHLLDFAEELVKTLDYDSDGLAERWYPDESTKLVYVSPHIRFGKPIVATGISTQAIYDRYEIEESEEETSEWFDVPIDEIRAAIHFEEEWRKKSRRAA